MILRSNVVVNEWAHLVKKSAKLPIVVNQGATHRSGGGQWGGVREGMCTIN